MKFLICLDRCEVGLGMDNQSLDIDIWLSIVLVLGVSLFNLVFIYHNILKYQHFQSPDFLLFNSFCVSDALFCSEFLEMTGEL